MMIFGVALVAMGMLAYAVSVGQQKRVSAGMASEAKRRPHFQFSRPGEISGIYTKMKGKFAKDERAIKNLRLVSICSMLLGLIVVGVGLLKR